MKLSLRVPRFEILVIAAVSVLAVIVTLLILGARTGARERRAAQSAAQAQAQAQAQTAQAANAASQALTLEDFILPEAPGPLQLPDYYPFRPRLPRWSREQADRFWISPRQVAVDLVSAVNDRNMEELFKNVP